MTKALGHDCGADSELAAKQLGSRVGALMGSAW